MQWSDMTPLLVGVSGLVTAIAAWFKVRHGEGNKRLEVDVKSKELNLIADRQDNSQVMSLVSFQQGMLEKHQAKLDTLQAALESKAEQEAENRAELRLMSYQIQECEDDRIMLRARVNLLEQSVNGHTLTDNPEHYKDLTDSSSPDSTRGGPTDGSLP